jgi:hypothetical protein
MNGDDERRPEMYPSQEAREIAVLLRISRELDVCGDLTATVENPSELIACADHERAPIRGHIAVVLACDRHPDYWDALDLADLPPGRTRSLTVKDLTRAWEILPITAPDPSPPEPPDESGRAA